MDVFEKGNFYKIPDDEFSNFIVALPSAVGAGSIFKKKKKQKQQKQQAEAEARKALTESSTQSKNADNMAKTDNQDLGLNLNKEESTTAAPKTTGLDQAPLKTEDLSKPTKNYTPLYIGIGAVVLIGGYFLFKKK